MSFQNTSMMREFPYLYRGVVVENKDPKNLGRCKVRVPSIHGSQETPNTYFPWARGVSHIFLNTHRGSSVIPEIGDIVWILFEGGDTDYPVYIGGTRGVSDIPATSLEDVILYQEDDDFILYSTDTHELKIKMGDATINLSRETSSISLKAANISIEGALSINGTPYITESE